jgi:hypothetical protein
MLAESLLGRASQKSHRPAGKWSEREIGAAQAGFVATNSLRLFGWRDESGKASDRSRGGVFVDLRDEQPPAGLVDATNQEKRAIALAAGCSWTFATNRPKAMAPWA